jgi:hypothetical protein
MKVSAGEAANCTECTIITPSIHTKRRKWLKPVSANIFKHTSLIVMKTKHLKLKLCLISLKQIKLASIASVHLSHQFKQNSAIKSILKENVFCSFVNISNHNIHRYESQFVEQHKWLTVEEEKAVVVYSSPTTKNIRKVFHPKWGGYYWILSSTNMNCHVQVKIFSNSGNKGFLLYDYTAHVPHKSIYTVWRKWGVSERYSKVHKCQCVLKG